MKQTFYVGLKAFTVFTVVVDKYVNAAFLPNQQKQQQRQPTKISKRKRFAATKKYRKTMDTQQSIQRFILYIYEIFVKR